MPMAMQPWMKSRPRRAMNSPRTSRASCGHDTIAIASTMVGTVGVNTATTTKMKMKDGMVWKISVSRISTSSTLPP